MEVYVPVVNDFWPLIDVTKNSILDVERDLSLSVIIHIIIATSVTEVFMFLDKVTRTVGSIRAYSRGKKTMAK